MSSVAEIASLRRERDPLLRAEALLALAGRLEAQDQNQEALSIYSELESGNSPVADRARRRLQAFQGRGSFGDQAELAFRHLFRSATDPAALVAMGAAGTVYRLGRLSLLSRLAVHPEASFLTRGLGARALASTLAFGAEGAVFPLAYDVAAASMGLELAGGDLGSRILSSYCVLGGLRLSGMAGRGLARRYGVEAGYASLAFGQATMFGGILAGHGLERAAGLREERPLASTLAESLATLIHFNIAGSLLRRAGGPSFEAWNRRLDWQSESLGRNFLPARRGWVWSAGPTLAESIAGDRSFMSSQDGESRGTTRRLEAVGGPEARAHQMANSAWAVFVTMNAEGKVVDINPAVESVFGYRPEEVLGRSLGMLMPPDLAARHEAGFRRYLASGQRRINWGGENLPGLHKNGQAIGLHISFGEFERGGERFFTGIMKEAGRAQEEAPISEVAPSTGPAGQRTFNYNSLLGVTTSLLTPNPPLVAALALGDVRIRVQRTTGEGLTAEFMENFIKVLNFHSRQRHLFESGDPRVWIEVLEDGNPKQAARIGKRGDTFAWEMAGTGRASSVGRTTGTYDLSEIRGPASPRVAEKPVEAETEAGDRPFARATQMLKERSGARITARLPRIPGFGPEAIQGVWPQFEAELNGSAADLPRDLALGEARVALSRIYAPDFFVQHEAEILGLLRRRYGETPLPLGYRLIFQVPGIAAPSEVTYIKAIGGFRRE